MANVIEEPKQIQLADIAVASIREDIRTAFRLIFGVENPLGSEGLVMNAVKTGLRVLENWQNSGCSQVSEVMSKHLTKIAEEIFIWTTGNTTGWQNSLEMMKWNVLTIILARKMGIRV